VRSDFYTIGRITKSWGLKGEVVVEPLTDYPERFHNLKKVWVAAEDSEHTPYWIDRVLIRGQRIRLQLKEVANREGADALVGKLVCVTEDEVVQLPKGTHFIDDIIGSSVIDERGERIGTVTEVWKLPANDVYVVRDRGHERLIPAVQSVIEKIDTKKKQIEIRMIEGL
jgi:16S rRNA processing protein RimM